MEENGEKVVMYLN